MRPARSWLAMLALAGVVLVPCDGRTAANALSSRREIEELTRVEALRKDGKLDEAAVAAARFVAHADPRVRAAALGILGRVALKRSHTDAAITGLSRAASLHGEAGEYGEALRAELALVFACIYQGRRFSQARAGLARAEALASSTPDGLPAVRYFQGVLAYETGDLRSALPFLRDALRDSAARGLDEYQTASLQLLARLLQLLGREDESAALLEKAERAADAADECTRADVSANIAWFLLRSSRKTEGASKLLDRTLALRPDRCWDAATRTRVITDYAMLHLREGRDDDARRKLEEARHGIADPDGATLAVWLEVEGHLAQRAHRPAEALALFERLAGVAELGLLPTAAWRAALGQARALEALGRIAEAGEAYERAEALLAKSSLLVPADEGRVGFLGTFDESALAAVGFFLTRDPAKAASIARRARARAMASLRWGDRVASLRDDERARWDTAVAAYRNGRAALETAAVDYWRLPQDELSRAVDAQRDAQDKLTKQLDGAIASLYGGSLTADLDPPAPGELMLVYHPLDRGFAGFAIRHEGTEAKLLADVDPTGIPEALSRALLQPFHDAIARASKIRFIAAGVLQAIDLHALPWEGQPLIASLPVAYGADAGPPPRTADAASALVVADPRGDLPAARREATLVSEALLRAGFETRTLLGGQATYGAVRDAIEAGPITLFHYAGHGQFGGAEGWESRLRLADGGSMGVGDIIALRSAPSYVVLSGCETGRAHEGMTAGGLGLAHAFLIAGARAVVAAPRPVDDALAAQIAERLYDGSERGDALTDALAERLCAAELAVRTTSPEADWATFRLLVP